MPKPISRLLLSSGALCTGFSLLVPAYGQSTYATIQGTVQDASGAAVPNATVTITNDGTGTQEVLKTGGSGEYRAFDLNAGIYSITFAMPGFGDQTVPHQTVLARQIIRLDASLKLGAVASEVQVNGGANNFTDDATVSHSLSSADINTLALNFRASDSTSPLYVATLTPGVQTDPSGNISVAGLSVHHQLLHRRHLDRERAL